MSRSQNKTKAFKKCNKSDSNKSVRYFVVRMYNVHFTFDIAYTIYTHVCLVLAESRIHVQIILKCEHIDINYTV